MTSPTTRTAFVKQIAEMISKTEGNFNTKLENDSVKATVAKALSELRATLEKAPKQLETLRQRHKFFLVKFFVWIKDKFQQNKISKEIAKIDAFVQANKLNTTAQAQVNQSGKEPEANDNLAGELEGLMAIELENTEEAEQEAKANAKAERAQAKLAELAKAKADAETTKAKAKESDEVEDSEESDEAEEAKAEEAKAEKAEEAKADEAKAKEAKADEAKAEESDEVEEADEAEAEKAEEAKADEAKADEAKAKEAKADEAKADEAKADEAKADEAKADEAKAKEAKALAKALEEEFNKLAKERAERTTKEAEAKAAVAAKAKADEEAQAKRKAAEAAHSNIVNNKEVLENAKILAEYLEKVPNKIASPNYNDLLQNIDECLKNNPCDKLNGYRAIIEDKLVLVKDKQ